MSADEKLFPPILILEDTPDDLFFLQRLLVKAGIKNHLVIVDDGQEAMAYLKMASASDNVNMLPCVILTDLKMPGVNGLDFTAWVRNESKFRHLGIIMLSSSDIPHDAERARAAGVDMFFTKFPQPETLRDAIRDLASRDKKTRPH